MIYSRDVYDAKMVGIHKPFAKTWNSSKYASIKGTLRRGVKERERKERGREREREREM